MAGACDSPTETPPAIALALSVPTLTLLQGQNATVTVTITRTNYNANVELLAESLPAGVTAVFSPAALAGSSASSILTLAASATAAPGPATLTVRARGNSVDEQTATLNLTVNVAGSYSLTMSPAAMSVAQGATASATVNLNRVGGFAGDVALTVSGAPSGVTATLDPAPVTGNSATLSVTAGTTVAPGSFTLTIQGTTAGLSNQSITLPVQLVTATTVTLEYCPADVPIFVAYQNEGASWTRVNNSGSNSFAIPATQKVGVAIVWQSGSAFSINVFYATVPDLQPLSGTGCIEETGTHSVGGTISPLNAGQYAEVRMGPEVGVRLLSGATSFTLPGLPSRALDLVAVKGTETPSADTPERIIIRRAINPAQSAQLPLLDFAAAEAVAPVSANLTVAGVGADEAQLQIGFTSATGTFSQIHFSLLTGGAATIHAVPEAQLIAGDMHTTYAAAFSDVTGLREVVAHFRALGNQAITMGAPLNAATVSSAAASPYLRLRGQIASQSDYNTASVFFFEQPQFGRFSAVIATAGYFSGTPATWTVEMPDLSGVTGFQSSWALQSGRSTNWLAVGYGGSRAALLFGAAPSDGESERFSSRQSGSIQAGILSKGWSGGPERRAPLRRFGARPLPRQR